MSKIIMAEGAAPSTPSSGKAAIYIDTNGRLAVKDDAGVVLPGGIITSGSWTPTIFGSSTAGSHTYTTQDGAYFKIGRLIYAWFNVRINTKDGAMAGSARISGLPVAALATSGQIQAGTISRWLNLANAIVFMGCHTIQNTTTFSLLQAAAEIATMTDLDAADIANSTQITGSIVYISNSEA